MKNLVATFLFLLLLTPCFAQKPIFGGGGSHAVGDAETPMTAQERQNIQKTIDQNIEMLHRAGKLLLDSDTTVLFGWPLRSTIEGIGYHGISNFVDQKDTFPNQVEDYNCGVRSYDLNSGYNHQGIDFFTWPFPWNWMADSEVEIVAVAPGTIVSKQDGNNDKSCSIGSGTWNAVYVQHADGKVVWYGHMKKNSLTSKNIGDTVERGEYLGVVGSSGNSTGPHLHLETKDANASLLEPYSGECNRFNETSLWLDQRPYYDSAVNFAMTGDAPVELPSCPNPEVPHDKNAFNLGERVYFTIFYRDQLKNQTSTYSIIQPDGAVFSTWTHKSDAAHYSASWWYWYSDLPNTVQEGNWQFKVEFEGQTFVHDFSIGDTTGTATEKTETPAEFEISSIYPNPFSDQTSFSVKLNRSQNIAIEVYDLLGRRIKTVFNGNLASGTDQNFTLFSDDLPGGVYILRVSGETFTKSKSITVLK